MTILLDTSRVLVSGDVLSEDYSKAYTMGAIIFLGVVFAFFFITSFVIARYNDKNGNHV